MFKKVIIGAAITAGVVALASKVITDILNADKEENEVIELNKEEKKEETEE